MQRQTNLSLLFVLALAASGCDSDDNMVGTDGGNDADAANDAGNQVPDATVDGAVPDGQTSDATIDGSESDAAMKVTADKFCEAVRKCDSSIDLDECKTTTQSEMSRFVNAGCEQEANVIRACLTELYERTAAQDACDLTDPTNCLSEEGSLAECLRNGGEVVDFSCDNSSSEILPACYSIEGNTNGPDAICGAFDATEVEVCPEANAIGRCDVVIGPKKSVSTTYYEPLGDGISVESLKNACATQSGTWTDL